MTLARIAPMFGAVLLLNLPVGAHAAAKPTTSSGLRCTIVGTAQADVLRGTAERDVICGLGGNDRITGLGGDDVIDAGPGNDVVYGGPGDDLLYGGGGSDRLHGDTGTDVCDAGAGDAARSCSGDSTPPLVAEWSVDNTSVDTAAAGKRILAVARVTDAYSGVARVKLSLVGEEATYGGLARRSDGNGLDGTYRLAITLPAGAPKGPYALRIVATDRAGKVRTQPTTIVVTQTGKGDTAKPFFAQWNLKAEKKQTKGGPTRIRATARVTDDFSGVEAVFLRLVGPGGANYGGQGTRIDGDDRAGVYERTIVLPEHAAVGDYVLHLIATDRGGNRATRETGTTVSNATASEDSEPKAG